MSQREGVADSSLQRQSDGFLLVVARIRQVLRLLIFVEAESQISTCLAPRFPCQKELLLPKTWLTIQVLPFNVFFLLLYEI